MNIKLDSVITERAAGLQAAAVIYKNIEVSSSPQMLKGRLRLFQESLFSTMRTAEYPMNPSPRNGRNF